MLKSLCYSIYRIKSRKSLWIQQLKLCSTLAKENIEKNNESTDQLLEKENEILKVINKSKLTQLKRHIELPYAEMIISCRDTNGSYKSLNDLLLRNKLESDILNTFCHSILNYNSKLNKYKKYKVTPEIKNIQIPKTTLGIHVGHTLLSWALVTNTFEVLEWDCIPWFEKDPRSNCYDIIKLIGSIIPKLPTCDSYVTEDVRLWHITNKNMVYCQKQLTIAIMACLKVIENQKLGASSAPVNSVYVLPPRGSAIFYNLIVGFEVVSPDYVIRKFINNDKKANNDEFTEVYLNDALKNKYLTAIADQREQMSWSLLKAAMFVQLVKQSTSV
ncbi:uncharacterized protein LOC117608712 [Osmia lignaria lignaria]|uniref:uncharacterized protein LOC117608712 n=1 Tax=Osmia lignaria lignaria TaxID=1437193 RepID=UPI00402B261C